MNREMDRQTFNHFIDLSLLQIPEMYGWFIYFAEILWVYWSIAGLRHYHREADIGGLFLHSCILPSCTTWQSLVTRCSVIAPWAVR